MITSAEVFIPEDNLLDKVHEAYAEMATLDELSLKVATKEISTATDALLGMVQDLKLNAELGNIMQNNNNIDNTDNNDNGNYSSSMKMNIDSA